MAIASTPDDMNRDRSGDATAREGGSQESADERVVLAGADEVVRTSEEFPSGGGESLPDRVGGASGVSVEPSERGSTGRGSTDAGKTDSEGEPGGGMAGSAGG